MSVDRKLSEQSIRNWTLSPGRFGRTFALKRPNEKAMTSLTYQMAQARISDVLRDAADRQRVHHAALRPHAALSQLLRLPWLGLDRPRRDLRGLDPRPTTH
jgi:hypothetical protein